MADRQTIVSNNNAVFGWAVMTVWMAMPCLFTWLAIRDGGIPGHSASFAALIFGIFWFVGLSVSANIFRCPRVRIVSCARGLFIEEVWLWTTRATPLARSDTARLRLIDTKDDEGAPYFKCDLALPGGQSLTLKESPAREAVKAAHDDILRALGKLS